MTLSLRLLHRTMPLNWMAPAMGAWLALACMPGWAQSPSQSVRRGQTVFESICINCHALDTNRAGPALRTVVGRTAGKAPGYFYSEPMESATHVWDKAKLKAWLTNPESVVPGQEMNFHLDTDKDRDDVVAYLASLSHSSVAKPKAPSSSPTHP